MPIFRQHNEKRLSNKFCLDGIVNIHYFVKFRGVYFWKMENFKGVPNFWVLLHFYALISKIFQISVGLRRGGPDPYTCLQGRSVPSLSAPKIMYDLLPFLRFQIAKKFRKGSIYRRGKLCITRISFNPIWWIRCTALLKEQCVRFRQFFPHYKYY